MMQRLSEEGQIFQRFLPVLSPTQQRPGDSGLPGRGGNRALGSERDRKVFLDDDVVETFTSEGQEARLKEARPFAFGPETLNDRNVFAGGKAFRDRLDSPGQQVSQSFAASTYEANSNSIRGPRNPGGTLDLVG